MVVFRVIDLESQARAVARYVKGWNKAAVLKWLSQSGDLEPAHPGNPDVYRFHSYAGISTGFLIKADGQLVIIGDHTTWAVPIE
jgi:hypothetical protein